ncbi:MAG: ComEC/Rec2 family competence protein [Patescibacteria group bacterium]
MDKKIKSIILPDQFKYLAISFLLGIAFSTAVSSINQNILHDLFLITCLFLFVLFINHVQKNSKIAFVAAVLFSLFLGYGTSELHKNKNQYEWPYDRSGLISGQIINRPIIKETRQEMILETDSVKIDDQSIRQTGNKPKILVYLPKYPIYNYGDQVEVSGKIIKPEKFEDFNFENYLKKYPARAYIKETSSVEKTGSNTSIATLLIGSLYSFSGRIEKSLSSILPEPEASFAAGLVLGQKTNLPKYLLANLQITGTTHLIALSGYNVTIIINALVLLLSPFLNKRWLLVMGGFLVLFFIIMTGLSPSVVRAAIFSLLLIFGKTIGRKANQVNLMLLAAVAMVIFNPNLLLYDIGFQLSFAAFSGIIIISPLIDRFVLKTKLVDWPAYITKTFSETLSAQLAVMPIIVFSFKIVSLISPIANLAVLWIIPWAMFLVFIGIALSLIWLPLGKISIIVIWPVLKSIIFIINLFSRIPLASFSVQNESVYKGLSYLILAFVIIIIIRAKKKYEKII